MGRLLSIDFGRKRCGIAATDPLRIIANGIATVRTCDLAQFVKAYAEKEGIDAIVMGLPTTLSGQPSESQRWMAPAVAQLKKALPDTPIVYYDERFTSALAHRAMIDGGMKKSDRQQKGMADMISAAIILNDYLQSKTYTQQ